MRSALVSLTVLFGSAVLQALAGPVLLGERAGDEPVSVSRRGIPPTYVDPDTGAQSWDYNGDTDPDFDPSESAVSTSNAPSPSPSPSSSGKKQLSKGQIAGITVGTVAGAGAGVGAVAYAANRYRHPALRPPLPPAAEEMRLISSTTPPAREFVSPVSDPRLWTTVQNAVEETGETMLKDGQRLVSHYHGVP